MHQWGDEGVDWKGINDAASYIGVNLRRWGRVGVLQFKEKYGTVRVYCSFGWDRIHSITHPGYAYNQYPKWLSTLDHKYGMPIVGRLNWIVIPFQKYLYRLLYTRAVKKWPHLRNEIVCGADYSELLVHLQPPVETLGVCEKTGRVDVQ